MCLPSLTEDYDLITFLLVSLSLDRQKLEVLEVQVGFYFPVQSIQDLFFIILQSLCKKQFTKAVSGKLIHLFTVCVNLLR